MSGPQANKSRQLANDLRKSHWTLGNSGPKAQVSEYLSNYQKKDAGFEQSQKDKLNVRQSHFQLGTGDASKGFQTLHQKDYKQHIGFVPPTLNEDKKRDLRSSHFVLGNYGTQFTTLNRENFQQKHVSIALQKQEQEEQKNKMRKHNHNFNETSKKQFSSEYNTKFNKAIDPENFKQGLTAEQLQQKVVDLRKSHVVLGEDYKPMQSIAQADYTAKPITRIGAANDNVAIRRTNFQLGQTPAQYSSVYQDNFVPHAAQKSEFQGNLGTDLRASHFTLGQEEPMYATNTASAYRGPPVGFKPPQTLNPNLQANHFTVGDPKLHVQNKTTYSNFHRDFGPATAPQARDHGMDRGSNFHLGGQKDAWQTESQAHYKAHEGAKAADLEDSLKKDLRSSHFKFDDVKTNQYKTLTQASYVPKAGEPNKLDEALKKDLQTNHFKLGAGNNFWATTSGSAYQAQNGKPSSLDPNLAKDLRANHFNHGDGKWQQTSCTEYRSNYFWKEDNQALA